MKVSRYIVLAVIFAVSVMSCNQHSSCPAYQSDSKLDNGTDIDTEMEWVSTKESTRKF